MKRNDFLKVDMKSDESMRSSFYIFILMMLLTNVNNGHVHNGHIQMILPILVLEHWLHLLQFLGVSILFTIMLSVSTRGYWNNIT